MYEYKLLAMQTVNTEELNKIAAEGWRLIHFRSARFGNDHSWWDGYRTIWERRLESEGA